MRTLRTTAGLAWALFFGVGLQSAPIRVPGPGTDPELKLVILLGRHGVRSPLQTNEALSKFASEPWPAWPVAPGVMTEHGARLMALIGGYFHSRYVGAGLLSGNPAEDRSRIFLRADSDQRTLESAARLGAGLLPGEHLPVSARPQYRVDPLFSPVKAGIGQPDLEKARSAVLGRIGGSADLLMQNHRREFELLQKALYASAAESVPPGKTSLLTGPVSVGPPELTASSIVTLTGALHSGLALTEAFLLEYEEGRPMSQVGWGRVGRADLTELLTLHSLYFDLVQKTFYPAQVQGSNLARHIEETIQQRIAGRAVPGAVGPPDERLLVLLGHDTNLINLAGLFGLSWTLPGSQTDPVLPCGSLVMEVRQRAATHAWFVRLFYISPTLEQLRNEEIGPSHPPFIAPLFIPGCSEAGYDAPWQSFQAMLDRVVDPNFVVPGSD